MGLSNSNNLEILKGSKLGYQPTCISDDGVNMGSGYSSRSREYDINDKLIKETIFNLEVVFNSDFYQKQLSGNSEKNYDFSDYDEIVSNPMVKPVNDLLEKNSKFISIEKVEPNTLEFNLKIEPGKLFYIIDDIRKVKSVKMAMYELK